MRRLFVTLLLLGSLATAFASGTVTGRVVKVLPLLLDARGRDAVSPSLYDRDAYQVYLRQPTNEISAIRFAVWWKASNARDAKLKLRVELRGSPPAVCRARPPSNKPSRPVIFAAGLR